MPPIMGQPMHITDVVRRCRAGALAAANRRQKRLSASSIAIRKKYIK
jgi:hypothetical protein